MLTAAVFSGGGARGAFEAGVIRFVCERYARTRPVPFDILTGTSVGAIHAAFLAGLAGLDRGPGVATLVHQWTDMRLHETVPFSWMWLAQQLRDRMRGESDPRARSRSMVDTRYLQRVIVSSVSWAGIRRALRLGRLRALAVPATQVATGRAAVFYETAPGVEDLEWKNDPNIVPIRTRIGPRHVLGSAAIPVFFPPVEIDGRIYADGSLRINTPLSPALRLGADRLLVVRIRQPEQHIHQDRPGREMAYSDPLFLMGKAFEALMLESIDRDLNNLRMINGLVEQLRGREIEIDAWGRQHRGASFRVVEPFVITPSEDISDIAYAALRKIPRLPRFLRRLVGRGSERTSELLSYLLFDRAFTRPLIDLGYADARRQSAELDRLFLSP